MKELIARVRHFFRTHNPAVERKYDVTTKVYNNNCDGTPTLSRHRAGSFRVSLWQAVAFLGGLLAGLCLVAPRRTRKRKK